MFISLIQLTGFFSIACCNELPLTTEEKAWLATHPDITIAYLGNYAPYSFQDQQGVFKGISVDLTNEVARRAGIRLRTYPNGNWTDLYSAAQRREVDIVGGILRRPDRDEWFHFTKPYLSTAQYIITRKQEREIQGRNDIAGKKIALVKGYATTQTLLDEFPSVKPYYVKSVRDAFEAVSLGKADACLGVMGAVQHFIAEKGIQNLGFAALFSENVTHWRMSVRKDWPLLRSILDKSLASITDEQRQKIFLGWTTVEIAQAETFKSMDDNLGLTGQEKDWIDQGHTVSVRVVNIPPYIILHEDREPEGISIDYLNLISERTGIKFKYTYSGKIFFEALDGLKKREGPDLISSMVRTAEREKSILFSKDYYRSPYVIFARMEYQKFISDIADLRGMKIALPKGTVIHEKIMEMYPDFNIVLYGSDAEALEAVATHKADIYIGNMTLASFLILEKGLSDLKIVGPTSFGDHVFAMGIREDWPELASITNKVLANIPTEVQANIRNKYVSIRYEHTEAAGIKKWLSIFGGVTTVIIFLFFFWNRSLKKLVTKRTSDLKFSEERYDLAMRFVNDGLYDWDLETDEIYYSDGWKQMLGYEPEEIENESSIWEQLAHPDDVKATWQMLNEVIEGKRSRFELEFRMKHKDGHWVEILSRANVALNDVGKAVRLVGTHVDITERKKEQREKKHLEMQLQQAQKMEAVGTLAGGIAHDFNNILSAVIGFTELALDAVGKDTHVQKDLQEVYTAGLRAKELVRQILTFARQSDEELKPIQIAHIIKEVMKFIRSSLPTSIEIKHTIASDSYIMGNTTQLHQIMMNLCTNAAHSMDNSGGVLEITLKDITVDGNSMRGDSQLKSGNYIEIKVSDTGDGIDPQIIDKIFEPYFTTKGQGEGTGMGLAMVHGIVDRCDGTIVVKSILGKGTTFTINLPVVRETQTHQQFKAEKLPTGKERILFVDDEAQITEAVGRILGQLGYSVVTQTSSVEAFELFKSKPDGFDLVMSDVTMPQMTGDLLTKKLLEIRPDLPVILCTGYAKRFSEKEASEIGARAFAYKPIVKEDLAKTVRSVLDAAQVSY